MIHTYILEKAVSEKNLPYRTILQYKINLDFYVDNTFDVSLPCLEQSLINYICNQDCSMKFNLNSVQKQSYQVKKGPVQNTITVRGFS